MLPKLHRLALYPIQTTKFLLTLMRVLAPWSVHARHLARPPIDMSGNYSAHMSAKSLSKITPFSTKKLQSAVGSPKKIEVGILINLLPVMTLGELLLGEKYQQ